MLKGRCLLDTCLPFACPLLVFPDLDLSSVWPWEDRCPGECDSGSGEGRHLLEHLICVKHLIIYDLIIANKAVLEGITNPISLVEQTEMLKK